jgi:hypothetical protein
MAGSDYYLCDVCGRKAFYDAELNYQWGNKSGDPVLDNVGSMIVLCNICSEVYRITLVRREEE